MTGYCCTENCGYMWYAGGVGSVCRALQQFYPHMTVSNLDMPSVVDYAKKKEEETGASKLNYVAGTNTEHCTAQ